MSEVYRILDGLSFTLSKAQGSDITALHDKADDITVTHYVKKRYFGTILIVTFGYQVLTDSRISGLVPSQRLIAYKDREQLTITSFPLTYKTRTLRARGFSEDVISSIGHTSPNTSIITTIKDALVHILPALDVLISFNSGVLILWSVPYTHQNGQEISSRHEAIDVTSITVTKEGIIPRLLECNLKSNSYSILEALSEGPLPYLILPTRPTPYSEL